MNIFYKAIKSKDTKQNEKKWEKSAREFALSAAP